MQNGQCYNFKVSGSGANSVATASLIRQDCRSRSDARHISLDFFAAERELGRLEQRPRVNRCDRSSEDTLMRWVESLVGRVSFSMGDRGLMIRLREAFWEDLALVPPTVKLV